MKWLRHLFFPHRIYLLVMYKDGKRDEKRAFVDEKTMFRWHDMMNEDGYQKRGFIESIPLLTNSKGN